MLTLIVQEIILKQDFLDLTLTEMKSFKDKRFCDIRLSFIRGTNIIMNLG